MFIWSDESIRFARDAAAYTRCYTALAQRIAKHLPADAQVCDAGCGLGYLSLALAPFCAGLTAVDTEHSALAVLEANLRHAAVVNVRAVRADIHRMRPDTPYDAMVFCFFGSVPETLAIVRAQCRGKAFLIKKNYRAHRFTKAREPLARHTFSQAAAALRALGVPFTSETFSLEMGQPFRSLDAAERFFRLHAKPGEAPVTRADAEAQLIPIDSDGFLYFLPARSELGMIVLDASDVDDGVVARLARDG